MKVREILHKNKFVWNTTHYIYDSVMNEYSKLFPISASKRLYKNSFGRSLNIIEPKSLNEKLMYLKLQKYWNNEFIGICADKYRVRKFVKDKIGESVLTELYGVWDSVEEINWSKLPQKFAIKCNHGSGYNIVCDNKMNLDILNANLKLSTWMKEQYGVKYVEQGIYNLIPHKIIAEEFIETADGLPPKDYKFFCSFGKCKLLFVASERYDGNTKFDYYYPDWSYIQVQNYFPNKGPTLKPKHLEQMIKYAEKLSEDFPIVRVDFYNEGDRIIFGELTFTHFGCLNRFTPDEFDYKFGELFPDISVLRQWNKYKYNL